MTSASLGPRLTQLAAGGGCACKIPPGELETLTAGLAPAVGHHLLVGFETGDDAAVLALGPSLTAANGAGAAGSDAPGLVVTADFFTPVVDDPYDWGRIAAANALSDVYAMGGQPLLAVNLLAWPRSAQPPVPIELAREVLNGGAAVTAAAGCAIGGGHSIDDPQPKYGLAVTGLVDPARMLRIDAGRPGDPLTLSKPLGVGVLNNRHKATGETFPAAVDCMTTLNGPAARAALDVGARAATDVTGFGLLGHLHKLARASGCAAVVYAEQVPYLRFARESAEEGFIPGGSRRNLDWVRPALDAAGVPDVDLLLLADAQTSGGLLVAAETGVGDRIGELVAGPPGQISVR